MAASSFFAACIAHQNGTTELFAFSPEAGSVVEIAYPMSNGRRIVPSGLFGWLRRRGLIISCFCGLKTGKILSTRIVDAISDGHTKVFCHYQPSRCQFYIDVNDTYISAARESEYNHISTKSWGIEPDMAHLITAFKNRSTVFGNGDDMVAPYFDGYAGSYASQYPGQMLEQLNGPATFVSGLNSNGKCEGNFGTRPDFKLHKRRSWNSSSRPIISSSPSSPTPSGHS